MRVTCWPPSASSIPRPLANYNEAVTVGDLVFAAGQLASDFKTGVPPQARKGTGFPFYGSDIELQTAYILENLKKTFEAAGSSLDGVLKCNVYCVPGDGRFQIFNEIYGRYFPDTSPARIFMHVPSWPGPFDVEIDCVAVI